MEQKERKKRPHFKPQPGCQPFCLQPRDVEILKLVHELRFASTEHIGRLIPGSYQQIQRRLRGLYDERYLDRPPEQNARRNNRTQHYVYGLGYRGAQILREEHGLNQIRGDWTEKNREVANLTILHQLMIADFRTSLTVALREGRAAELVFWRQGHELLDHAIWRHQGREWERPVYPDAWFVLRTREGKDRHFFLEADNSTMRLDRVYKKMEGYFWYWLAGREEYINEYRREKGLFAKAMAFRVLTIAKSAERARNLVDQVREMGPQRKPTSMFWFTPMQAYSLEEPRRILGPIWTTAKDSQKMALI